jgi:hypothetical protein
LRSGEGRRGLDDTRAGGVEWVLGEVPEWLGGFGGGHRKVSSGGDHGGQVAYRGGAPGGDGALVREVRGDDLL